MNSYLKKTILLISMALIDFSLILILRLVLPEIFILMLTVVAVIAILSLLVYFVLIQSKKWFLDSLFAALIISFMATVLTLTLHGVVEKNLSLRNFSVPLIAFIVPFISGVIYKLFHKDVS